MRDEAQVTYLFTDIEGSTRLWAEHPTVMGAALNRHLELLAMSVRDAGGEVHQDTGDGVLAVFPTARAGVAAAVDAQRAVASEDFGDGIALRVRMGLHTGATDRHIGAYRGPPLNRAARITAAAHGGQVLVSDATRTLAEQDAPDDVGFVDLGVYGLRGLEEPERIHQVIHPALQVDFPRLRSDVASRDDLPRPVSSFVGREGLLREISKHLAAARLVTLTGVAGVGKSRLALRAAEEVIEESRDEVWLVELTGVADPADVPKAIASAAGVQEAPGRPVEHRLLDAFGRRSGGLLVLDNCEHVLDSVASLLARLLPDTPVTVLATSRERIDIPGEVLVEVGTFEVPEGGDPGRLRESAAIRLFADRVATARGDDLTDEEVLGAARICARLDGIPLAIELAAARARVIGVVELAERIDDRFGVLGAASRTASPHQRTLRGTLDWSYDLLTEPERLLLERLSVFAGAFTLPAAEGVCGGDGLAPEEVLHLLAGLVDKSLVVVEHGRGTARYRLLDTIRAYAGEKLDRRGEADAARGRHAHWYVELAASAEPELRGPDQKGWLARLESAHEDLRAAMRWMLERGDPAVAADTASRLRWFWVKHDHFTDALRWLRAVVEAYRDPDGRRARVLSDLAYMLMSTGAAPERILELIDEAQQLARDADDDVALAWSLFVRARTASWHDVTAARRLLGEAVAVFASLDRAGDEAYVRLYLGISLRDAGEYEAAGEQFLAVRRVAQEIGDPWLLAWCETMLGVLARYRDDHEEAVRAAEEALTAFRELDNDAGMAFNLALLGMVTRLAGELDRAVSLYEEAIALGESIGNTHFVAEMLGHLGEVAHLRDDDARARELLARSLELSLELDDIGTLAMTLRYTAGVAVDDDDGEQAARLLGAADALRREVGDTLRPHEVEAQEQVVEALRGRLGDRFETVFTSGEELDAAEAVRLAVSSAADRRRSPRPTG